VDGLTVISRCSQETVQGTQEFGNNFRKSSKLASFIRETSGQIDRKTINSRGRNGDSEVENKVSKYIISRIPSAQLGCAVADSKTSCPSGKRIYRPTKLLNNKKTRSI
jgi:hypothetical protein